MNHCISDTMALRDRTVLINSPVPHIHASVMSLDRTCMISDYCTFTFFGIHMLVRAARCIDTRDSKATAEGRGEGNGESSWLGAYREGYLLRRCHIP